MVFNTETLRKAAYLVAGILPAAFFGTLSLVFVITPLIFWSAAAWIGIAGLILAYGRRPYDELHAWIALMLVTGVAAMAPFTFSVVPQAPIQFEWQEDYSFALILLCSVSPMLVALHYLFFQTIFLLTSWLSTLIPNENSDGELKLTDAKNSTNA